ncbi:MAG TPA: hypothetical protein VD905_21740 [Flavobacteriales bacterium]|nr:hypothetical protein [Flavobacteriales bacterium]
MKLIAFLPALFLSVLSAQATNKDSTGNVGDNLDLQGVLDLFKNSSDIESFEKAINSESNHVNNLDLNKDGETDYIKVVDHADSNAHALVLQVPVTETESQDVAVIEIEKNGEESATIQIEGDDDVYGDNYLVEPYENYVGKDEYDEKAAVKTKVVVNVWAWPAVRFVYGPRYRVWVSPWGWRRYPVWWKPWRPVAWRVHWGRVARYHHHYRVVHVHRVHVAHRIYHRHRVHSAVYHHNHPHMRNSAAHPRSNNQPKSKIKNQPKNQPRNQSRGGKPKGGNRGGGRKR